MINTSNDSPFDIGKLEQLVLLAEKANKTQLQPLRKTIYKILLSSFEEKKRKTGVKGLSSVGGVGLVALIRKRTNNYTQGSFQNDFNRIVFPQINEIEELESRVCLSSQKIQSMSYKELNNVMKIFKNHGLEHTVDYILSEKNRIEVKSLDELCF